MKKQSKKTLALFLAILLTVGLFPTSGFAVEAGEPATPSSIIEAPQATPTPEEQTPEASATPEPAETPQPTPATNSSIDISGLSGEDLYVYLKTLEGDALKAALSMLTQQQIESLKGYATQMELAAWFSQALDFTKMSAAEIADYLRSLESNQARIDAWIELTTLLDADKMDAIAQEFTEEEFTKLFSVTGNLLGAGVAKEDFSNAGPLLTSLTAPAATPKLRSMAGDVSTMSAQDTGIQLNKTVSLLPNGKYKIRLESYTTGTVTDEAMPADIVLVLDVSGSMNETFSKIYTFQIYNRLQNSQMYNRRDNLYFKLNDGTYTPVTLTRVWTGTFWSGYYQYTYSYVNAETTITATSDYDDGDVPWPLYSRIETNVTITRLQALKAAVNNFIDSIKTQNDSITNAANKHRIAIVTFATDSDIRQELLTVDATGANTLKGIVNGLRADGATAADYGMANANSIFSSPTSTRNRVTVMFTDGYPNHSNGFSNTVASDTIAQSKKLKDKSVTVFTVGIFPDAEVNAGGDLPDTNNTTNKANRYMHLTSSNYPNATSLTNFGTGGATGKRDPSTGKWTSYYLTASSADALNDVFQGISRQVGAPTVRLGQEARIKDTISAYFRLTTPNGITVKTADASYAGGTLSFVNETVVPLTPTVNGKTITVSGFNFDENYVSVNGRGTGNTFHGKMLIIEIEVEREPSFIGGNNVETNVPAASGLYDNASSTAPRQTFGAESPIVNVPIRFKTATLQNKDIYAGDDVTLTSLFTGTYTTDGGSTYTLGHAVTNEYADVAYTVYEGATPVGTYTVPAGSTIGSASCTWTGTSTISDLMADKNYTVEATVMPSQTAATNIGSAGKIENHNIGSAKVNVYTPHITPKDLSVYLTQNPSAQLNVAISSVAWKHGPNTANTGTMGPAPELTYTFSGLPASPDFPEGDTDITITSVTRTDGDRDVLTAVSTINKTAAASAGSHFKVFVLKPTVTCTDTRVFLGDSTNLTSRYSGISWTGTPGAPAVAAPFTAAPVLTITPVKVTGTAPGSDLTKYEPAVTSTFKVKIAIGGVDITAFCKILNNSVDVTAAAQHFTVNVVTGSVTITKTGGVEGESYIFILESDTGIRVKEVIQGNGSKVIKGLPKGTYTVTEETTWSWRYKAPTITWANNDRTLGQTLEDTAISCSVNNKNRVPFWLSGESFAVNRFNPYAPTV